MNKNTKITGKLFLQQQGKASDLNGDPNDTRNLIVVVGVIAAPDTIIPKHRLNRLHSVVGDNTYTPAGGVLIDVGQMVESVEYVGKGVANLLAEEGIWEV